MGAWIYLRPLGVITAACVLLTGCGQSGPLTLPEDITANGTQSEEDSQDDEQEDEQE